MKDGAARCANTKRPLTHPLDDTRRGFMERICSEPECNREFYCRGLCEWHYGRARRAGTRHTLPRLTARYNSSPDERLRHTGWTATESGCWEWNGQRDHNNYGRMSVGRGERARIVSRVAYEAWVGPIPDGSFICHRCDNPPCINPEHLFLGTPQENVDDMVSKDRHPWRIPKTHCPHGHEYTPENTYWSTKKGRWKVRVCRTCTLARQAKK